MSRKIKKSELIKLIKAKLKEIDFLVKEKLKHERGVAKENQRKYRLGLSKKHLVEKSKHIGGVR
jgi:hypothetical protein